MGLTAENVAERCNVSREAQDEWAVISQNRAVEARDSGHFDKEIVPVTTPDGTTVTQDDGPRPGTTMEKLAALQAGVQAGRHRHGGQRVPAQRRRRRGARHERREGRARSASSRARGSSPRRSRRSARRSWASARSRRSRRCSRSRASRWTTIDIVEINEAFAAQIVPCKEELGIDDEKLNPFGGAIALGHPFGMTGARIMTTLHQRPRDHRRRYGIESMCVAGGMGQAMLIERLN
jgi:acetyl-CoA C-acetyltransferase